MTNTLSRQGPASSCRIFDFTLTFEAAILSLLPSCMLISLAAAVVIKLWDKPRLMQPHRYLPKLGKCLINAKMLAAAAATIVDAASAALWSRGMGADMPASSLNTAALAMRVIASVGQGHAISENFFKD